MEDTGQCHRSGGDAAKRQYYRHRQRQKYGWNGQWGYKEQIRPDAVIHMNGTRVVAGDELLYEHFMDKELLKRLLSYGEEREIAVGLTIDDKDYFVNPAEVERIDKIRWERACVIFRILENAGTAGTHVSLYWRSWSGV